MQLPMLGLSETSSDSTIVVIRDTLPDGRAFYVDMVYDPYLGVLMRTDEVGMQTIRNINNDRVAAQKENIELKADIVDCEKEKFLKDKEIVSLNIKNYELNNQYITEQKINKNNSIVLKDYKKQAFTGKIVIIAGGVSIGIGVGLVIYSVIKTNTL